MTHPVMRKPFLSKCNHIGQGQQGARVRERKTLKGDCRKGKRGLPGIPAFWMLLVILPLAGCSRSFWRQQADDDSYRAIAEHITDPRWSIPRFDVSPDPRSRFYDPYDPDSAPLPPDDPHAHAYMHWVDGWEGYKGWHKFGDLMTVENPQWLANFGISTDIVDPLTGEYLDEVPALQEVTLAEAVELAQIHNRDYQSQIENVYLTALAVTFQRFQFGVRYLGIGTGQPSAAVTGTGVPGGTGDRLAASAAIGVSQLLPAGTQWAVELANNTLWLFGGGNRTESISTLSYSIVQPLLLGAGRQVGLENLTQVERELLYRTRDLARFRKILFTDVVGGPSGYLGLLQQAQGIRNARNNIFQLEDQVEQLLAAAQISQLFAGTDLETLPDDVGPPDDIAPDHPEVSSKLLYIEQLQRLLWSSNDPITEEEVEILRNLSEDAGFQQAVNSIIQSLRTEVAGLDVLQLQSQLTGAVNQLRASERGLQDSLDSFKILLGLPPDMVLTIDESLLEPFNVIDDRLRELEQKARDFIHIWGQLNEEDPHRDALGFTLDEFVKIVVEVEQNGLQMVYRDLERVQEALPRRLEELDTDEERRQLRSDVSRAEFLIEKATSDFELIEEQIKAIKDELAEEGLAIIDRVRIRQTIGETQEDLIDLTQNLMVVQASLRVELIEVQPFDLSMEEAVAWGLENRLDLMNARAQVMDARRRVEVIANRLRAGLDVVIEGDINTPPGNRPLDFRGSESQLRAGLRFSAPLDQIDERNSYRAALIAYQRERRNYMAFEDQVKQQIRQAWRQMYVLRRNLETSRRAVRIASLEFDSAVSEGRAPVEQARAGGLQGQNLLRALDGILRAQNELIQNWINYERNRLNIYRDMDIMEVGPDGLWDDPFYRKQAHDDETDDEIREFDGLDTADHRSPGGGGLGRDLLQTGLASPVVGEQFERESGEPDRRSGGAWTVSRESLRAGTPGQPAERDADQPGRGEHDDHQPDPRRDLGDEG